MNAAKNKRNEKKQPIWGRNCRSILVLIVLVFLLVVSIMWTFAIHGLKLVLLDVAASANDKVYLTVECQNNSDSCYEEVDGIRKQYDGEKVGTVRLYQGIELGGGYFEVSASAVSEFLIADLGSVPMDKIPVLVPSGISIEGLDEKFVIVGSYAGYNFNKVSSQYVGIFTLVFKQIETQSKPVYMIDDGAGKIEKFLLEKLSQYNDTRNGDAELAELLKSERQVIVFDDYEEAAGYRRGADKIKFAIVADIFGDVLEIDRALSEVLTIFCAITGFVALLVVAAIADVYLYVRYKKAVVKD